MGVLCALDWWEEIDDAEDASVDEEMSEMSGMSEMSEMDPAYARSISTADARLELRNLIA